MSDPSIPADSPSEVEVQNLPDEPPEDRYVPEGINLESDAFGFVPGEVDT